MNAAASKIDQTEYPLVVSWEQDETNVRYIITVTGRSGRSYADQILDRDERGNCDSWEEAKRTAKGVADRLKRQGQWARLGR